MTDYNRRDFGKLLGATGASITAVSAFPSLAIARGGAKVVIVGGGAGGATLAHYVKRDAPALDVTLIEANPTYCASFFSNPYLAGLRTLESLSHGYAGLRTLGVNVVHDVAVGVNPDKKHVKTKNCATYPYDRLVLSPGIDIKYESVAGYSRERAAHMPHAYDSDVRQKLLLKQQLEAMRDGGIVVIAPPNDAFRRPPAAYERACMVAHYLKTTKPRSKIVILDPRKHGSKQEVFVEAMATHYPGIVEWNQSSEVDDFAIAGIDAKTREITTRAGKTVKADVANIIPEQRAGEIAVKAGCTQGDWCPVNPETFASTQVADIYVLGDAAATPMPKSAFAANSQAKVVASDILGDLAQRDKFPARFRDASWSLLAPNDCVKLGANYTFECGELRTSATFMSRPDEDARIRSRNLIESVAWYTGITADMFAAPRRTGDASHGKS